MSFKLYFKFGVMGCSKSAQALMTKFNYEQQGYNVLLLKSNLDTRDQKDGRIVCRQMVNCVQENMQIRSLNW